MSLDGKTVRGIIRHGETQGVHLLAVYVPHQALVLIQSEVDRKENVIVVAPQVLRQIRYVNSAKIFLQCRRRFWEEDEGIFGGATLSNLPIRTIYYPEHGRESEGCFRSSVTIEDARVHALFPIAKVTT